MPRHYLINALITLLPALVAGSVGHMALTALARIAKLTADGQSTPYLFSHAALPFAVLVGIVWILNHTDLD